MAFQSRTTHRAARAALVAAASALAVSVASSHDARRRDTSNGPGHNVHLLDTLRFSPLPAGGDSTRGRALFGLAATDGDTEDKTGALFEGPSMAAGREIESNQRTCFTCHRGESARFGLGPLPLSGHILADDALFLGMQADAQGDPDAMHNLEELGLVKYRPNRFNPSRDESDPFRQVFFWRKTQSLVNVVFAHGLLNDGRARVMFETARGAVFSHTQALDDRFDDLFPVSAGDDLEAFQATLLSDPRLAALLDPDHPLHDVLVDDPFYTVPIRTRAQQRGRRVFEENCMTCHDTPNVFNNRGNVEALGNGDRPVDFPTFAPATGRMFDVGVSERNRHHLRFTVPLADGTFAPVVLPLTREDGTLVEHEVTFDVGLAATTGRLADVGRFKVPQLRGLAGNAPYFHDNSAATLEEVVDHFLSPWYRYSRDGRAHPISMTSRQRRDLIAFLEIL